MTTQERKYDLRAYDREAFERQFGAPPHLRWLNVAYERLQLALKHYHRAAINPGEREEAVFALVDALWPRESIRGPMIGPDGEQLPSLQLHPVINRTYMRTFFNIPTIDILDVAEDLLIDSVVTYIGVLRQIPE